MPTTPPRNRSWPRAWVRRGRAFAGAVRDRWRYGALGRYVTASRRIPGWTRDDEAIALAQACYELRPGAVVVEIGSFLGCSAVLLAGARKLRGSGLVHCIDPFDASGDAFSTPIYREIAGERSRSLRERFDENLARSELTPWVRVHEGKAAAVAEQWTEPIDLLFLDGDQSPDGARIAYEAWIRFLRDDGIVALHNSSERTYAAGHDGMRRLVLESVLPPHFKKVFVLGTTTFARKVF